MQTDSNLRSNTCSLIRTLSPKVMTPAASKLQITDHCRSQSSTDTYDVIYSRGDEQLYTVKLIPVYVHNKLIVRHLKSSSICSRITSAGFLLRVCSWREREIMFYYATAYSCTATHKNKAIDKERVGSENKPAAWAVLSRAVNLRKINQIICMTFWLINTIYRNYLLNNPSRCKMYWKNVDFMVSYFNELRQNLAKEWRNFKMNQCLQSHIFCFMTHWW